MGHVEVAGVRYELPDGRVLLDEVSFRVGEGAKVALVGANGRGRPRCCGSSPASWCRTPGRSPAPAVWA